MYKGLARIVNSLKIVIKSVLISLLLYVWPERNAMLAKTLCCHFNLVSGRKIKV